MQLKSTLLHVFLAITSTVHAGPITKRDNSIHCFAGTANTIQKSDWNALANEFFGNRGTSSAGFFENLPDPVLMTGEIEGASAGVGEAFATYGTAHMTLDNEFVFENTHVSFTAIANQLAVMMNECCGGFDTCIGGTTTVNGDSGLAVTLIVDSKTVA